MKTAAAVVLGIVVLIAVIFVAVGNPFLITKTTTVPIQGDAYVGSKVPENYQTNFGSASTLDIRQSGDNFGADARRSWIRFDFSSLGVVEGVTRASLSLQWNSCTLVNGAGKDPDFRIVSAVLATGTDWTESGITWFGQYTDPSAPTYTLTTQATIDVTSCPAAGSGVLADVTSAVRGWTVSGQTNSGFELRAVDVSAVNPSDNRHYTFRSDEGGSPILEIEYTQSGEAPPEGVGEGTNQTADQNITQLEGFLTSDQAGRIPLAAILFVITFFVVLLIARRKPGAAVVLGFIAGTLVAVGYIFFGG